MARRVTQLPGAPPAAVTLRAHHPWPDRVACKRNMIQRQPRAIGQRLALDHPAADHHGMARQRCPTAVRATRQTAPWQIPRRRRQPTARTRRGSPSGAGSLPPHPAPVPRRQPNTAVPRARRNRRHRRRWRQPATTGRSAPVRRPTSASAARQRAWTVVTPQATRGQGASPLHPPDGSGARPQLRPGAPPPVVSHRGTRPCPVITAASSGTS